MLRSTLKIPYTYREEAQKKVAREKYLEVGSLLPYSSQGIA